MLVKIKSLFSVIKTDLADTWQRSKVLILAIGAAIIALEWTKIKDEILLYAANSQMKKTETKDQTLAAQEDSDKTKADALVQQANQLADQQPNVSEDWYKNQGNK